MRGASRAPIVSPPDRTFGVLRIRRTAAAPGTAARSAGSLPVGLAPARLGLEPFRARGHRRRRPNGRRRRCGRRRRRAATRQRRPPPPRPCARRTLEAHPLLDLDAPCAGAPVVPEDPRPQTRCCASRHTSPCICPERPMPAGSTPSRASADSAARPQSSGLRSAQPGLGVESGCSSSARASTSPVVETARVLTPVVPTSIPAKTVTPWRRAPAPDARPVRRAPRRRARARGRRPSLPAPCAARRRRGAGRRPR